MDNKVTGQLADLATRGWTTRGLVNSWTGQVTDRTTHGLGNSRTGHLVDWTTHSLDSSRTRQVADWSDRGLDNSWMSSSLVADVQSVYLNKLFITDQYHTSRFPIMGCIMHFNIGAESFIYDCLVYSCI